jgi:hypothetical protein
VSQPKGYHGAAIAMCRAMTIPDYIVSGVLFVLIILAVAAYYLG